MPQKACERWFCHVMAFAFYIEMPQNRRISFSVPFLTKKLGHLRKKALDQFSNKKGTENEILRFWDISK